jgi:HAE1 family hydrophobic/amphiphilic exporter-1
LRLRAIPAVVALTAVVVAALPLEGTPAQSDDVLPHRAAFPTAIPSPRLPAVPTVAPGYRGPDVQPTAADVVGVLQHPFVGITLQDAIAMALLKNPNLAVSASNSRIARYRIVQAKGNFDVQLRLEPSSNFSVTPPENLYLSGPGEVGVQQPTAVPYTTPTPIYTQGPGNIIQHKSSFQYGVSGQTVNGMAYAAGIQQTRTYNNIIINDYNPTYQASLNLALTQPLLKNGGMNPIKHALKLSLITADTSEAQALVDASNTLAQVEDTYWNLVAAWRAVAIFEEALKAASAQEESVIRLARRGVGSPVDAVEAQTQVANFQTGVFQSMQTVSQLQIQLKSLIVASAGDPIWQANLVPSSPVLELPSAGDLNAIVAVGVRNRPEMRQALDQHKTADVDRAYAKDQALPQADLQVQYMSNGFAGILAPTPGFETFACNLPNGGCPTPPPESQGKMPYAYHNLWAARYPAFNIALVFNIPLEHNYATSLKHFADQEEDQASIYTQNIVTRIQYDARNALQLYQSALSRLNSSSQARTAAEAVEASEVRRFHRGSSTTFLVLRRQVELAQARGRELQAQTDLNKAVVELERVQGTILTINGVNVQTMGARVLASPIPLPRPTSS